jgi:hypothetical protein
VVEVPGISGVFAELEAEDSLKLGDFLMGQKFGVVHSEVGVVVGMYVRGVVLLGGRVLDFDVRATDVAEEDPVVVAFIEVFEVDVVAVGILISGFGGVIIYN